MLTVDADRIGELIRSGKRMAQFLEDLSNHIVIRRAKIRHGLDVEPQDRPTEGLRAYEYFVGLESAYLEIAIMLHKFSAGEPVSVEPE